ncbi:MAG TPA: GNAT family N-acetyltransferase [Acidimicrobiales bacterium]|nr:GNAT family N-acetyltransferase [Acidimicrobiales bacterium]
MRLEFLSATDALRRPPDVPDIYYTAGYGLTAELIDRGVWECAVSDDGMVSMPYLRRDICGGPEYDIVSPYGYAGVAVASADQAGRRREFRARFLDASRERGLVAEFVRTNPLDVAEPDLADLDVGTARRHRTFAVKVGAHPAAYWDETEGRHRTAVRKAERSGVEVMAGQTDELLDETSGFRRMYRHTMERVAAGRHLRLGTPYFRRMVDHLRDDVHLLEARFDGEVCAAALFLSWNDRLHYHLSGSTEPGLRLGATNAILDRAVRTLLRPGGVLHLGGGLQPDDGLERFKRSIATEQCSVFFCQTVVNERRYRELVEASGAPESGYFPAYRAEGR